MNAEADTIPAEKPARRRRAFDKTTLQEYAELAAKKFNDQEICSIMEWPYHSFQRWKSRQKNNAELANLLTRARTVQLRAHLENIEDAERGKNGHRPDWRASAHLLAVKDASRFALNSQAGNVTTNQTAISITVGGDDQLRKLVAMFASQAKQLRQGEQAALPPASQDDAQTQVQSTNETTDKPVDV